MEVERKEKAGIPAREFAKTFFETFMPKGEVRTLLNQISAILSKKSWPKSEEGEILVPIEKAQEFARLLGEKTGTLIQGQSYLAFSILSQTQEELFSLEKENKELAVSAAKLEWKIKEKEQEAAAYREKINSLEAALKGKEDEVRELKKENEELKAALTSYKEKERKEQLKKSLTALLKEKGIEDAEDVAEEVLFYIKAVEGKE